MQTYSLPEAMDWNEDGKIDLLLCGLNGSNPNVLLYINEGTKTNYKFGSPVYVQSDGKDLKLTSPHTPHVIDYNFDGKKDLMVGTQDGKILYYENRGTNENPELAAAIYLVNGPDDNEVFVEKTWNGTSSPEAKPHFCDWDGDGKWDIIMGGGKAVMDMFIAYGVNPESTVNTIEPISLIGVSLEKQVKGYLLSNHSEKSVTVSLFSTTGALVSSAQVLQSGTSLSIGNTLAQGVYFAKVQSGNMSKSMKFVIR